MVFLPTWTGCGYLKSGMWDDDPKNWKRAFGTTKPDDVQVVHSQYYRSAHFTYEFHYYFEIEHNEGLRTQLSEENSLVEFRGVIAENAFKRLSMNRPDWFASKDVSSYQLWGYADETRDAFLMLIDRETDHLLLTDTQY